jgi:protein TonB
MAYRPKTPPAQRLMNLGIVGVMHVGVVWGLLTMLDTTDVPSFIQQIQASIIEEQQQVAEEAPPPPKLEKPPPVYVPPVEIAIESTGTSTTAIQAVTSDRVWPKAKSAPKPPYPPASQRLKEEGKVLLALYVDEAGRVQQAKVEKSSGFPLLDESALTTARNSWRFTPGRIGGQPAAMWFKINVEFRCFDPVTKKNACGE